VELLETLSSEWAIRAILASSMVGVMCGVIGCFIVLRNMSLIGDALSHAVLPGIFVAFVLVGYSTIGFFTGSVIAGLLTAVFITWLQHNSSTKNDAAIGIVFTAMFSLGVIGISWLSQEQGAHLDLKDFLFGNILGISTEDLIITAVVTVYTLVSVVILFRYLFITTFQPTIAETMGISVKSIHYFLMLLLSFSVVAALRSVGVILVVAMLITPASTALLLSDRLKRVIVISAFCGLLSAVGGMIMAIQWDTTPGPLMVIFTTILYLITVIFAPRKGYLTKRLENIRQRKKVEREDIIRLINKGGSEGLSHSEIENALHISPNKLKKYLDFFLKEGVITNNLDKICLTAKGTEEADKLVRAHRLWESYQVDTMGLEESQIHDEADRLEHLLSEELLDEVDAKLGFPITDPHGSPIPRKSNVGADSLLSLRPKTKSKISENQKSQNIVSELWELGLLPKAIFSVERIGADYVQINASNRVITIPAHLAKEIKVEAIR
jgi:ABC-type Mn2+/Zn2+ transport system permease subunit/Mn-dependent DtxR family transcriptional regulator